MRKRWRRQETKKKKGNKGMRWMISSNKAYESKKTKEIEWKGKMIRGKDLYKRTSASYSKGIIQIDYIIAAGIFLAVFAFLIHYTTDYYSTTKGIAEIATLRSKAFSLLGMADMDYPDLDRERIGLHSYAYRLFILLNNTEGNLISGNVTDLSDEVVEFNLSSIFSGADYNSTAIYYNENPVPYSRSGDIITFKTDISANQSKFFTIYFDDNSNFTDRSVAISGSNRVGEQIYPVERISLLQYRNLEKLENSNYTAIKNNLGNLHISIYDLAGNLFFSFGDSVPRKGNIVALQRYILYQNSTAGVNNGKLVVRVW